jgi:transcriptional regulator with XRE-family HTH domain
MISITLKNLRKQKGWKQEYVAVKIFRCRTAYVHYETGRIIPGDEVLKRIADLYDMSVTELKKTA